MERRPPCATLTDTLFPYTTRVRADGSSAGSITAAVIEPDGDSPFQSWEDSAALLRVLNEHGSASVEDRATLITPHGRPVEFADVTVAGYLVSTHTQLVPDTGSPTNFHTAEIETGTQPVAVAGHTHQRHNQPAP